LKRIRVVTSPASSPSLFSPLAQALVDAFADGVVVFDTGGRVVYVNAAAREQLGDRFDLSLPAHDLLPHLAQVGGRLKPLRHGELELGEAMFIPNLNGPTTLAEREKESIVRSLDQHGWRLAETARSLGISRTTLWRRLRAYGLQGERRTRLTQAS
jgi:transcriptional regulator of acetoin/glycerol metabolism